MKIFEYKGENTQFGVYFRNVMDDESPSHQYRHCGFFTSKHSGGSVKSNRKNGNHFKSITYNFGIELVIFKLWFSITQNEEIVKPEKPKKVPVKYKKSKVLIEEMYDEAV